MNSAHISPATRLILCVFLTECVAKAPLVTNAPGSHGNNFPLSPFALFRMNATTPKMVQSALGTTPFDLTSARVDSAVDEKLVGRTAISLSFLYSSANSCLPQKWAHFLFVNSTLHAYDMFSELPGESKFGIDYKKLALIEPGTTRRGLVLKLLGTPNHWDAGMSLPTDGPETIAYEWIASNGPPIRFKRARIIFDREGIVKAPPVVEDDANDESRYRWLCQWPPPVY